MYDVVLVANILLDNAPDVPLEPGTRSGLLVLGNLFKAMAFGSLLQVYERIPLQVGLDDLDAAFASREEGLTAVLQLLNSARTELESTPLSDEFLGDVLEPGLDLANTIDAMLARYALVSGDLAGAAAAAARVDPGVLSEARFSATDGNPLWNMWYNSGNAFRMRPEDRFRLEAEAGDGRVAYWVAEAAVDGSTVPLDEFVKYSVREHAWPFYLPDEMRLIRAEVAARQGDLAGALALVNEVRTPCASALDEPVACLPALSAADVPTEDAMLQQILHERAYELFLQGVRWSDLRRLGVTPKYPFMMVAETECERNPSAPAELCGTTG
jgi:peptidoglycan hydrolase-like protein with peptidoglycan-binding domain